MATHKRYKSTIGRYQDIPHALELLCMEYGETTPTAVLNFCQVPTNDAGRAFVLYIANQQEYKIIKSGRGFKISDKLF